MITNEQSAIDIISDINSVTRVIEMLYAWQEDLESGPMDSAQEWEQEMDEVISARRALAPILERLRSVEIEPDLYERLMIK